MIAKHILLTVVVGAGSVLLIRRYLPQAWGPMQYAGAVLLGIGFIFWTTARFQLGASFTASAQARQLVTHGLYSRIRNPIYIFGSCVIAGMILVVGHPSWLLIFMIIVPLQIRRARKESGVLEAKFGDDYRQYKAGTWF